MIIKCNCLDSGQSPLILTHWGRVTHICVSKQTIIGSDNSLSPGRRQAIIWTNAGILLIRTLGTNFSEILIEIRIFSFKKMGLKVSSAKWRPFCLGLNVLTGCNRYGYLMLSVLIAEQTPGEMRSMLRSQFDHLSPLHWIADIRPGGIILSVVL